MSQRLIDMITLKLQDERIELRAAQKEERDVRRTIESAMQDLYEIIRVLQHAKRKAVVNELVGLRNTVKKDLVDLRSELREAVRYCARAESRIARLERSRQEAPR